MLDHEFELMESRLDNERPNTCFFAFADSVAAINYRRTIRGNGWLGERIEINLELVGDLFLEVKKMNFLF